MNSYSIYLLPKFIYFCDFIFLDGFTIHNYILQRFSDFVLQSAAYGCLKGLLCLYFFIEDSKSDILEVSDGRYLFFEKNFLSYNVYHVACVIFMFFVIYLVRYPFSKTKFHILIKYCVISLLIPCHNVIYLPSLKFLYGFCKLYRMEYLILNLLLNLSLDFVGRLLQVNSFEKLIGFIT